MNIEKITQITFPKFTGIRCLMMPYIQGDPDSVPSDYYAPYLDILRDVYIKRGDIGFLTIDESLAVAGNPHRGARAKYGRALHTEVGRRPGVDQYGWGGGGGWGDSDKVRVDKDVEILLSNNQDNTCAVWDSEHWDTSYDGDIGDVSHLYPYAAATMIKKGEVWKIGIFTPHESIPISSTFRRQFLRIVSFGVHGREDYFTANPKVKP